MDTMMITDAETSVMESKTPVNVAINPGREKMKLMDAVPPVKTAASKTMMVKLFLNKTQKSSFFYSSFFHRKC